MSYLEGDPGTLVVRSVDGTIAYSFSRHRLTPGFRELADARLVVGRLVRLFDVDGHIARLEVQVPRRSS